jgi:hypothetical protein
MYLQLQLHKFLELVMTCSTNSRNFYRAGAVPNRPYMLHENGVLYFVREMVFNSPWFLKLVML